MGRILRRWHTRVNVLALVAMLAMVAMPISAAAIGGSRVSPAASDQPVTVGPWTFTISEILTGDGAAAKIAEASAENPAPAEGMQYIAVHLSATNTSPRAYELTESDFGVTGDDGLIYQFDEITSPDPGLEGTVEAGASLDGWVVSEVPANLGNLMLVYNSTTIDGDWADALIALTAGATIPDRGAQGEAPNDLGKELTAPAKIEERVVTGDWAFTVKQVIDGQAVYDLFPSEDYRTTALGDTDQAGLPYWVAIQVEITNNRAGGKAAYIGPTAFQAVMDDGDPVPDALILTPPNPPIDGYSYPGGTRTGWVLYSMPVGMALDFVRFQPFGTDGDTRYITLTGEAGTPRQELTFTVGETVITIEDKVNLRAEPSTDADILEELPAGTALEITGEKVQGSGHTWYPVKNPKTGKEGYVVVDYLGYSA